MSFVLKFGWETTSLEVMPTPQIGGWKIKREPIWNSGAKRSSSAKFNGTLKANKVTLDIAFPPDLTVSEVTKLLKYTCPSNLSNKYCYIQFTNEKGETETKQFYFGPTSFDANVFMNGKFLWSSVQIQAVER